MARMTTARKLLLGLLGGSGAIITYLFRDEFTTDAAAGSINGTAAEPGPGTRAVTDSANHLSIVSGELLYDGTPVGYGDPKIITGALTRAAGLALLVGWRSISAGTNRTDGQGIIGWHTSTTWSGFTTHGLYNNASLTMHANWAAGLTGPVLTWANDIDYNFALILRGTGCFSLIKGGAYTDWTLVWMDPNTNTATMYAGRHYGVQAVHKQATTYMRVRQLPAPFTTDDGIATVYAASPTDQTEYTGNADAVIDLTVTAPGVLDGDANTRCGFYYRSDADLTPAWHAYVDGTGAFNLDSIASDGTRTNRITVAAVIAGGGTRTIRVIAVGTKHNAYTLSTATWTKRGGEIDVSLNDTVTTIEPSIPAGWTAANLRCYPRTSSLYNVLSLT
jgi:hypothetical protein